MFNHPEHNASSFINIMISAFNIISSIQNHHRHSKSPAVFKIFIIINILMIGNLVQLNFVLNHPEPNSIPAKCILINVINTVTSIIRIQNSQMAIQNSQLHGKGGQCQLIKLSKICYVANHNCSFTKMLQIIEEFFHSVRLCSAHHLSVSTAHHWWRINFVAVLIWKQ